jgi:PiT family inorganic phosphate transporter
MADTTFLLTALIVALALIFDYVNGFHDAANSIATVVSTRVLTPLQGVAWAAFLEFHRRLYVWHRRGATVGGGLSMSGKLILM